MNALIRMIRSDFERSYQKQPTRKEIEQFTVQAFQSRNIRPTATLVEMTVDHLQTGAPVVPLKAINIQVCGT